MSGVPLELLGEATARIFGACGVRESDARRAAAALTHADAVGMDTHGVVNLDRIYVQRLLDGRIDARARPRVVRDEGAAIVCDADNGLGLVAASVAMDLAIERARRDGVGAVAVRRSSHLGSAGYHASRALPHGMIGVASTNLGAQRLVPPPGGTIPLLGTNPLAIAVPAGALAPFLLDMSTTVVPTGRIRAAAAAGEAIPPGWLADDDGRPVTDPAAYDAGRAHLLWLGGSPRTGAHKGFGLGLAVDILSGLLSGAAVGPPSATGTGTGTGEDRDVGHFLLALRVDAFRPLAEFRVAMDALLGPLLASRGSGGDPGGYPGSREADVAAARAATGVPLSATAWRALREAARRTGAELPAALLEAARG